jgi:hypothetical protein
MVIDLGSHWLEGIGNAGMPGTNPTAALQGVRLTQIVTRQLAPRAAHFPPLSTMRQVSCDAAPEPPKPAWSVQLRWPMMFRQSGEGA